MTLRQKQSLFVCLVAQLIDYASGQGFEMTFGETYRSPEEAKRLTKLGKGIPNSLHTSRLAIDLNLFKNNNYLTRTEHYADLGHYWESLSSPGEFECCWGGRFGDGNHFSIGYGGRK